MLDLNELKEDFIYQDGKLYRNTSRVIKKTGYVDISYKNKPFKAHRLIYFYHHGHLPELVDHIDGNRSNNRIENLREASRCQNQHNRSNTTRNTSGKKNVFYIKKSKTWRVVVQSNNIKYRIGCFKDIELADLVAIMAREKYHGNFANHSYKE